MTVIDALAAIANRTIDLEDGLRDLFAHRGWVVPVRPPDGNAGTLVIDTDVANTRSAWIMSGEDSYRAACARFSAHAIGEVARVEHVDELLADLPDVLLRIDPGGPITLHLDAEDLDTARLVAQAVRVERAMREERHAVVRRSRFIVPYYGTHGHGHQVIALPTPHGRVIPIFTTEGAAWRFLVTGTPENQTAVKFTVVDGGVLFGEVVPATAEGVIVNVAGPEALTLDRSACEVLAETA